MRLPSMFLQAVLNLQVLQTGPVCMLPGVDLDSHFGEGLFVAYQQSSSGERHITGVLSPAGECRADPRQLVYAV